MARSGWPHVWGRTAGMLPGLGPADPWSRPRSAGPAPQAPPLEHRDLLWLSVLGLGLLPQHLVWGAALTCLQGEGGELSLLCALSVLHPPQAKAVAQVVMVPCFDPRHHLVMHGEGGRQLPLPGQDNSAPSPGLAGLWGASEATCTLATRAPEPPRATAAPLSAPPGVCVCGVPEERHPQVPAAAQS